MNKVVKSHLSIFVTSFAIGFVVFSFMISGCGHHHKHHKHSVAIINSTTVPAAPGNTVIVVRQPTSYDQTTLLNEILAEVREFNNTEPQINVTIEIDNEVNVENEVVVEGDKIVVRPGNQRRIPRMYHWFKKFRKNKCDRDRCSEGPKPCDNE
jgi:hypothetical protein